MSEFRKQLGALNPTKDEGRRWLYVPYDQLTDAIGPLSQGKPEELGVVLIESSWKAGRRPYHKQKLALILSNMRHFALEQAQRGVAVEYRHTDRSYGEELAQVAEERGPLSCMRPAERELRVDLQPCLDRDLLTFTEHEGWLTSAEDFKTSQKNKKPWRMDAFYRTVRRNTGLLMEKGKPVGGRFSFDGDNRERWDGDPKAAQPPKFKPDKITKEVGSLIEERFARHPGKLDLKALPATQKDAQTLWEWAKDACMENFGPYEDAMSVRSTTIFHTRISPLLNIHRLLPKQVVNDVAAMDIPINSKEGFIRQVLGWREFVRHVHELTDGFRQELPIEISESLEKPGDAGFEQWSGESWESSLGGRPELDGAPCPRALAAERPLPAAFWGKTSGLHCLDRVVKDVWAEAYSHHITRLMILSNLATLLDIDARQLNDWFWVAYSDAYDWVVEPNVLAMGTFSVGELMTTKPYVSGSAYISKMSDYCQSCAFDPKKNCPITPLYWAFLERQEQRLADNVRLKLPMASMRKRTDKKREHDREVFEKVSKALARGQKLTPKSLES